MQRRRGGVVVAGRLLKKDSSARRTDLVVGQRRMCGPVQAAEGTLWLQPPVLAPWHWEEMSEMCVSYCAHANFEYSAGAPNGGKS